MSLTFTAVIKWHLFTVSRLKAKKYETQSCEKFKQRCEPLRLEVMNILFTCTKVVLSVSYRLFSLSLCGTMQWHILSILHASVQFRPNMSII
jgi:hypothetical protein